MPDDDDFTKWLLNSLAWDMMSDAISQKGSHAKLEHDHKPGTIIFPNHGSQEIGKGFERKIMKDAGIK